MVAELLDRINSLPPEKQQALFEVLRTDGARYGVHPMTGAQRRMWLLSQLRPESPIYNVAYRFDISGDLDPVALERAVERVTSRHEALRTVFLSLNGEPRQVVLPAEQSSARLELVDLSTPGLSSAPSLAALLKQEARRPFNLARGPLVRATLYRTALAHWTLALTLHHIICDGWSMKLVYDDLAAAYAAYRDGTPLDLPPLPRYVDVSRRQEDALDEGARERLFAFWTRALEGAPLTLDLLTDRPPRSALSDEGEQVSFSWPADIARRVALTASSLNATPFAVLLAACQALLHRYTHQPDITVGCPVAGRSGRDVEDVVGLFVNTLVLRSRAAAATTFTELLEQTRDWTFAALAHQEMPFDALVEHLKADREPGAQPLFQVMVAGQERETEQLELSGLTVRCQEIHTGTAKFDLTFVFLPETDNIEGRVEYRSELFDRATILRMIEHLRSLLTAGLEDPERPVADLPLLSSSEREQLEWSWGSSASPSSDNRPLHALVESVTDAVPDSPAVSDATQTWTYRELDERANRVAALLLSSGVGSETPVGVYLPNCADLVVAFLAVLKAGGMYVPIDVQLPSERVRYMVADAGVDIVLTHAAHVPELARLRARVEELDGDRTIAACTNQRPGVHIAPDHAAYLIYTSGSSGRPKAVVGTHRGLRNLADGQREVVAVRRNDRVLQFHSPGFDVSISEFVTALCAGAELRVVARSELQPGADLARALSAHRITVADLPPVALAATDPAGLGGLRSITVGGEACPKDVAAAWASGREFYNAYGPTETTVTATAGRYEPSAGGATVPIGRPVKGVRAYVLDERLEPVPIGVAGELYVGGAGVARGYLGDPVLTAQRFMPDPFAKPAGQRMYRTGDIVRYLADGSLEFLGRADSQVKVRGYRIELGEIEATLRACPAVRRGAVTIREDRPGVPRLVAYVVGEGLTVERLRGDLQQHLPSYMIPDAFVVVSDLPMTPSGKLDHRALPPPSDERPVLDVSYVSPRDSMEERIAAVWRDVLGVARVGVHDNFFDLGGNSLLLAKVRARLAEELDAQVSALDLFRQPTVALLARFLSSGGHQAVSDHGRAGVADGRRALADRGRRVRQAQGTGVRP